MITNWFNPRVFAVALSIVIMVQVSKVGEPVATVRSDLIACTLMLLLYAWAFLRPLSKTLGPKSILGPAILLSLAWTSVALALIVDALPVPMYVRMTRHYNWPMIAFCSGAVIAFFLFFHGISRSFELHDEILEARGQRRES